MHLKTAIKRFVPYTLIQHIRRALYFGIQYKCSVCGASTRTRMPQGYGYSVLEELQVVGGMYKERDACPVCHAGDRDRLILFYLEKHLGRNGFTGKRLLHVAPEKGLSAIFQAYPGINYIAGDLEPHRYWHLKKVRQIDLLNLPFDKGSIDAVICNHVLEHVVNDVVAMREIRRVLSKEGLAILQTPIALKLTKTREGDGHESEAERIARYGQKDHVRVYTLGDYISRLESVGFAVECYSAFDDDAASAAAMRLNPFEVLFVCRPAWNSDIARHENRTDAT